jgi:hypothetical protein
VAIMMATAGPAARLPPQASAWWPWNCKFEIIGHRVPAVVRKDASGREFVVQPAEFVAGEGAPPPQAGVGTSGKIWSGTVIRVPQDEARTMRANEIAERSVDD